MNILDIKISFIFNFLFKIILEKNMNIRFEKLPKLLNSVKEKEYTIDSFRFYYTKYYKLSATLNKTTKAVY